MSDGFRSRLAAGEALVGTFVKSHDANVAEVLAGTGLDFLLADLDHSSLALRDLEGIVRAAALHSVPVVARLGRSDLELAGRVLDAGAAGIQVAEVDSAETIRAARELASYPPAGRRSLSLSTRAARFGREPAGDYLERAGREVAVIGQIESVDGIEALPSLVETGAGDAWFVGVLDLSASVGLAGRFDHPDVRAALDRAAATIVGAGARLGVFAANAEDARSWRERGATMIAVSSDYSLLAGAACDLRNQFG